MYEEGPLGVSLYTIAERSTGALDSIQRKLNVLTQLFTLICPVIMGPNTLKGQKSIKPRSRANSIDQPISRERHIEAELW